MPHPEDIQANLELQFKNIDKLYANNDLRVYGRDTRMIFKEVDVIRSKQIELAAEHISLEVIDDMSQQTTTSSGQFNSRNLDYFNKKKVNLKSLMSKLDMLGQIMSEFREASDLNPHYTTDSTTTTNRNTSSTSSSNSDKRRNSSRPTITIQHATMDTNEMSEATTSDNAK